MTRRDAGTTQLTSMEGESLSVLLNNVSPGFRAMMMHSRHGTNVRGMNM